MKRILKILGWCTAAILLLFVLLVVVAIVSPGGRLALPVKHKAQFAHPRLGNFPGPLAARGNQITGPDGRPIRLLGLMPPDPAHLDSRGMFTEDFFDGIKAANANVLRIAVHPERWVRDADYLWRYLDPIVGWAGEAGMYAIIDWHYIGNIETGAGSEMPDIEHPPAELTRAFWQLVAGYFRDAPNVIFEIWNEPAGGISSISWQRYASEIVQLIRAQGADQLIIVSGLDYSRELSWVLRNPIPDANVAYTAHIYPGHASLAWDRWFGDVSRQYPVLVTEWGFMDENRGDGPAHLAGSQETYGEPFLAYLDAHGIGWVACWYDDEWLPPMFNPGRDSPTRYGTFVLEKLRER